MFAFLNKKNALFAYKIYKRIRPYIKTFLSANRLVKLKAIGELVKIVLLSVCVVLNGYVLAILSR